MMLSFQPLHFTSNTNPFFTRIGKPIVQSHREYFAYFCKGCICGRGSRMKRLPPAADRSARASIMWELLLQTLGQPEPLASLVLFIQSLLHQSFCFRELC